MKKKQPTGEMKLYRYSRLIVVLVPVVLYISVSRLGFVYFDDDILIIDNFQKIGHLMNIGQAFRTDAFFANLSPYYRPLMNVSFMADAAIGGLSPVIYHLSNLLYHVLACLSLLWLLSLMGFTRPKALIATLVFAVHPMMGHAVLWIPARGDLLVTLFGLLSFSFFIRFLRDHKAHNFMLHVLCLAGAIFSKESAVFLPLLFVLWLLVSNERLFRVRNYLVAGSWLLVLAIWYYMRLISIDQRSDAQQGLNPLLQNLPFLPEAVSRFFFPFMLPVTPVFSTGYTLAGILGIILMALFIFRKGNGKNLPMVIFGAAWFIGFCLPNMFVRLVSAGDNFEYLLHRTYLPYVGLIIFLLPAAPEKWFELRTRPFNMVILAILVLLSAFSVSQEKKYTDAVSYWQSAIRYAPGRAWFHYYLGRYYFKQKDYKTFEKYLLISDSLRSYPEFKYNLGMVALLERKDYEKAYSCFTEAFKKGYGGTEAKTNFIALCIESSGDLFRKGSYMQAISRCEEALINDPSNGVAAYNIGIYLVNIGEKQRAASMWKKAIHLQPDLKEAYRSLCYYYQYDVKKADSAAWYAAEFTQHGGTGDLISPGKK